MCMCMGNQGNVACKKWRLNRILANKDAVCIQKECPILRSTGSLKSSIKKNKALKDEILKFWQTNQPTDQLTNQTAS